MTLRYFPLILMISAQQLFAQSEKTIERAYIKVINDGMSTAPEFVGINVKNLNKGVTKEICTEATSLLWSLQQELSESAFKTVDKYLLSKSSERYFEFKDTTALKRLYFDEYNLKNGDEINSIIIQGHLVDSLRRLSTYRSILNQAADAFYEKRRDILDKIGDSIKTKRPLTDEEIKMLGDLRDSYYDDYYTK